MFSKSRRSFNERGKSLLEDVFMRCCSTADVQCPLLSAEDLQKDSQPQSRRPNTSSSRFQRSNSCRDEESMKVHVDSGGYGRPGELLKGFGIEDKHERRNAGIRGNDGGQDDSCGDKRTNGQDQRWFYSRLTASMLLDLTVIFLLSPRRPHKHRL